MRIKKIINYGISSRYKTKLSVMANKEMYGHQLGESTFRSWEWKGYSRILEIFKLTRPQMSVKYRSSYTGAIINFVKQ